MSHGVATGFSDEPASNAGVTPAAVNYNPKIILIVMSPRFPKRGQEGPAMPPLDDSVLTWKVLKEAVRNVSAVKWAIGFAGIVAVLVIILQFKIDYLVAVIGVNMIFVGMVILVLFSHLAKMRPAVFLGPSKLLINFCTLWFIAVPSLLFTSVFFNWPLPFRDKYFTAASAPHTRNGDSDPHPNPTDATSNNSHSPASTPVSATPGKTDAGVGRRAGKMDGAPPQPSSAAQLAKVSDKDVDCDSPDGSYVGTSRPKGNEGFVKSFTRQVLDRESKKPLSELDVSCGNFGHEKRVTDIDGFFECTLPAHTGTVLVEITDSRYEHYYKRLNPACDEPILLKHLN